MQTSRHFKAFDGARKERKKSGLKSKAELKVEEALKIFDIENPVDLYEAIDMPYEYIKYETYKPDFIVPDKCMVLEVKGYLPSDVRTKMLVIKGCYPDLDIRFVFARPENKLSKLSDTTYAKWAEQHDFPWCSVKDFPPKDWIYHIPTPEQKEAFEKTVKLSEALEVKRKRPVSINQIPKE